MVVLVVKIKLTSPVGTNTSSPVVEYATCCLCEPERGGKLPCAGVAKVLSNVSLNGICLRSVRLLGVPVACRSDASSRPEVGSAQGSLNPSSTSLSSLLLRPLFPNAGHGE